MPGHCQLDRNLTLITGRTTERKTLAGYCPDKQPKSYANEVAEEQRECPGRYGDFARQIDLELTSSKQNCTCASVNCRR
jgi:hypothetical protein